MIAAKKMETVQYIGMTEGQNREAEGLNRPTSFKKQGQQGDTVEHIQGISDP